VVDRNKNSTISVKSMEKSTVQSRNCQNRITQRVKSTENRRFTQIQLFSDGSIFCQIHQIQIQILRFLYWTNIGIFVLD
jgi:hypothetical protein